MKESVCLIHRCNVCEYVCACVCVCVEVMVHNEREEMQGPATAAMHRMCMYVYG